MSESKCFIHFSTVSEIDEILIAATKASLCKIIECRKRWSVLDGEARSISEQSFAFLSGDDEQIIEGSVETLPTSRFYHRKCYQSFTNKRLIELAEKRLARKNLNEPSQREIENAAATVEPPRKSKRREKSSDSSSRGRTVGILPKLCIICKKKELFYNDKNSNQSFQKFAWLGLGLGCRDWTAARDREGEEGSRYKAGNLKKRLQKSHPQLVSHAPGRRNRSTLVFAENLSAGSLAEHLIMSEEESSDGEGCSDAEEERYCASTSTRYVEESNHVKLYRAAFILKNIIKDVPVFHTRWPPTADDFNKEAIIQTVPSELFNFLCWVLGLSDEPSSESLRGSVGESYECKIDSIAQDLVYLSTKGQKQTPKSLSLGILIRELTGSAEVINVFNYLGHCASYDTVIRHETALATIQSNNQSFVTSDMVKNQHTVLVFDNQDYNEETKSGKGQTHIAAGIAVQR
ncbi:Hypothetical predicted protein [Paramuricea clavata]|uniref:Uncharacterized protein n=1 Tax=Paramuricea clavata TaxID=317549 RepID=A0A6S7K0C0_PARCT|nr:Hypothetical predicted protein [Paramuricea clavata]